MQASRAMALFAADIPLGDLLRSDVVVHRMATITQRAGGTSGVLGGIKRHPPVGVRLNEVGSPHLVRDIPLRTERKIIVADLREVALLPLAAVDERDVVALEGHERIRF